MNATSRALVSVVTAVLLSHASAHATIVAPGYYAGTRVTVGATGMGGGLKWNPAAGAWSGGHFSISWNITPSGSDFIYQYTVKTPGALGGTGARLSHWLLELSPTNDAGVSLDNYWIDVFNTPGPLGNYSDIGIGPVPAGHIAGGADGGNFNSGIPGTLYGVNFERDSNVDTTVVTFTSPQIPVWGDFYARDGGGNGANTIYAYNIGFGTEPAPNAVDFSNWIARPDGVPTHNTVPEPASFLIWIGLAGVCGFGQRKRMPIV